VTASTRAGSPPARLLRWAAAAVITARPRQWPKNLLVLAAPLAGATLGRPDGLGYALAAAVAFLLASAAVYLANDVVDAERDRRHPRKRHRPVAAGDLPKAHAVALSAACAVAGAGTGLVIGVPLLAVTVAAYLGLSLLYSARLKHIAVVELTFVASGFLLRVLGGAVATRVPPSGWFLLVCGLGALGVAVAKRYCELTSLGPAAVAHRPALRHYRPGALRVAQLAADAAMSGAYLAWAAGQPAGTAAWHLASAVPLAAAQVRFWVLTGRRAPAPVEDLLTRDAPMVLCELAWLILFAAGLRAAP
jgi:decaprenyl-phosphate phosphoribosyltransferase